MPFERQSENKKTGTRLVFLLLVPVFKSVLVVWRCADSYMLGGCRQPLNDDYCGLVSEHQLAIKGIDENGLVAVNLFGKNLLAEIVEHVALNGALNGTCTKLGIVTKVGQKTDGFVANVYLKALLGKHATYRTHLQANHFGYLFFREW